MLKLLLETPFIPAMLVLLAILTPVGAVLIARRAPDLLRRRQRHALGALGPLLLALMILQEVAIRAFGFDSFFGMLLLLGAGLLSGIALGLWVRAESLTPPAQTAAAPPSHNPPD